MEFKKIQASKKYAHIVAYYWTLHSTEEDSKVAQYRFVPDAYIDWVFHLGNPWQCDFPNVQQQLKTAKCHVFGQIKKYINLTLPKQNLNVFGVKFHPWVANKIWNLDMHYLTDSCLALSDLEIPNMNILQERILRASTTQERITLVEEFLKPQLHIDTNISVMHRNLILNKGQLQLNPEIGLRRMQQRFKREIGISPKLFLRTLRINAVIESMTQRSNQTLTELAFDFDYFDQTHFIKDFKYFTKMSPSSFLKSINPNGDILNLRAQP